MAKHAQISPNQIAFDLQAFTTLPTKLALVVSNAATPDPSPAPAEDPKDTRARLKAAERLRAAGEKAVAAADLELSKPRETNTPRRANIASSIMKRLHADRALGETMLNLAEAIESGAALHLSTITTKAAVQTLKDALERADQTKENGEDIFSAIDRLQSTMTAKWGYGGSHAEGVIAKLETHGCYPELAASLRANEMISGEQYKAIVDVLGEKEAEYQLGWFNVVCIKRDNRLRRAGIVTTEKLKAVLREFAMYQAERQEISPLQQALMSLSGKKVGFDFFPTPAGVAVRMAQLARIEPGDLVFEPSAGSGNLADAARDAGADVKCLEVSDELRKILTLKGHDVIGWNFDDHQAEPIFDAVIMNPPFSNRLDCKHIRKAYECLKPGGVLVAIACEGVFFGRDKAAAEFREWLEDENAEIEKLPDQTFMDPSLPVRTGVAARLITVRK